MGDLTDPSPAPRETHADFYGEPYPYVSQRHRHTLSRDLIVGAIQGLVVGAALLLAGAAIARIVQATGWLG